MPRKPLTLLSLVLVTLAVYARVAGLDFVNFDDPSYVTANPHVSGGLSGANVRWAFSAFHEANWHPLTWLSHQLDVTLFGLDPRGHHLVNLLLHAANGAVLFLLLASLTGFPGRSAAVAFLFLLHPLHVESVAWVSERKDLLATLCWFLSLAAYLRHVRQPGRGWYAASLGLFASSLMAKPMAVTLPFLLLLLDWWPLRRWERLPRARLLREKAPFFLLSVASCIVTYTAQRSGGAVGDVFPLGVRLANAVTGYAWYLGKAFWPARLAVIYPFTPQIPTWQVVGAAVLLLGVSAALLRERRRRPWLLFGWCWFLGTLVPVIGLVQVGLQSVADRYSYVPLTGLFLAVVWGVAEAAAGRWRRLLPAGTAALLVPCALLTWRQVGFWRDSITLFSRAVAVTDANFLAHNNLATAYYNEERYPEAIAHYRQALAGEHPLKPRIRANLENALAAQREAGAEYARRGQSLAASGDRGAACQLFARALAIDPGNREAQAGHAACGGR